MTFEMAVWQTPLMVLVAGVVLGAFLMLQQKSNRAEAEAEGRRRDFERERASAIEALRALETEQDKMAPEDYERERKALLARGAAALRALEGGSVSSENSGTSGDPGDLQELVELLKSQRTKVGEEAFDAALRVAAGRGAPAAEPEDGMSPTWRGALYASAVWGLVALLVVFAGDQSAPRPEGGSMTGGTTMGRGSEAPMAPPSGGPSFESAAAPYEARLAENPDDLEALNRLTEIGLSMGDAGRAMQYNQRAAQLAPNDPDVGASKAALAAMVGMNPRAISLLDEVLAEHPDHARSLTYKGLLLMEEGRSEEAVPVLEKAVALQPGVGPLQQALEAAKRGEGLPQMGGPAPAPRPTHPPTGGSAGGGDVVISGTLALGPNAKTEGARTIFVSVRAPEGGPPLAAKQLPVGPFPMAFSITSADAIAMGGAPRPFPPNMSLSIRMDADGNAMTREGLASAGSGGVAKGTTGLELTLE